MSNISKDLPDERPRAGETLGFTKEELLGELAQFYGRDTMQEGDLTIIDLIAKFGRGKNSWRDDLASNNVPEGWQALKVRNADGRYMWVMRKVATL